MRGENTYSVPMLLKAPGCINNQVLSTADTEVEVNECNTGHKFSSNENE